ncbi:hypothetical protein BDV95DRAFT_56858 [Massariosphaeria phaeospora]|uniref:Uncharacterized protein n=1 Tax=Massariosphaeria phaeospora TaxID=100035 RepID=A0A7C8MNI1_9PLEO|nr:hypothetical protein BDV95DRAFT_56858 [Massariosphaeria phaeospora]
MPFKTTLLFTLIFTSVALSSPLAKRWSCGGEAPAFSCEPKAGCKDETAWGTCAYDTGLNACGDALPNQDTPVSACQKTAFDACEVQYC